VGQNQLRKDVVDNKSIICIYLVDFKDPDKDLLKSVHSVVLGYASVNVLCQKWMFSHVYRDRHSRSPLDEIDMFNLWKSTHEYKSDKR
jgi:hypothetical protein